MSEKYTSFVQAYESVVSGVGLSALAALIGRLMYHVQEVRAKRRKFFSIELVWEMPTAIGMAFVAHGLSEWLDLGPSATTGMIATMSYLGPRAIDVVFARWSGRKTEG